MTCPSGPFERLVRRLRKMARDTGDYDLGDYWNVCDEAADDIERLCIHAAHWKANHDTQVQRSRLLLERPDLPLERVAAYRQVEWMRNALEHIAGSCEGRAAELARAGLEPPNANSPTNPPHNNDD